MEVTLLLVELEIERAPFGTGSTQNFGEVTSEAYLITNFEKPWRP
jgi:hypothetical protein